MNQRKKSDSKTTNQVYVGAVFKEPPKQHREQDEFNFSQSSELSNSYSMLSRYRKEKILQSEAKTNAMYKRNSNNNFSNSSLINAQVSKKNAKIAFDGHSSGNGSSFIKQLQEELHYESESDREINYKPSATRSAYKHPSNRNSKLGQTNGNYSKSPLRNNLRLSIPQSLNHSFQESDPRKGIQTHGFSTPIQSPSESSSKERIPKKSKITIQNGDNQQKSGITSTYYNRTAYELVEKGVQRFERKITPIDSRKSNKSPQYSGTTSSIFSITNPGGGQGASSGRINHDGKSSPRNASNPLIQNKGLSRTSKSGVAPENSLRRNSASWVPNTDSREDNNLDEPIEAEKDRKITSLNAEIQQLQHQAALEKEERDNQFKKVFEQIEHLKSKNPMNKRQSKTPTPNNEKTEALNLRISGLENELGDQKRSNLELQEKLNKKNNEINSQTQILFEGLLKEAAEREMSLKEEIKKLQVELQASKQQNLKLTQNCTALEEICEKQKGEIKAFVEELKNSNKKTENTKIELLRVDQNYKTSYANKSSEIEKLNKKITESNQKTNLLITETENLKSDLERARIKNRQLLTELNELEIENHALNERVKARKPKDETSENEDGKKTRSQSILLQRRFTDHMVTLDRRKSFSGRFRLKNMKDVLANLRLVLKTLEESIWELSGGVKKKAIAIKDRFREAVSQLEAEIEFMHSNIDTTETSETKMPFVRDKSPTFGNRATDEATSKTQKKPKISSTIF